MSEAPPIRIRRESPEWREIRAYVEARLVQHRASLESAAVDPARVPELRARIFELKALLKHNPEESDDE